jgi:hypothetical protein
MGENSSRDGNSMGDRDSMGIIGSGDTDGDRDRKENDADGEDNGKDGEENSKDKADSRGDSVDNGGE